MSPSLLEHRLLKISCTCVEVLQKIQSGSKIKDICVEVYWLLGASKAVMTAGSSQAVQQKSFACRHGHLLVKLLVSMYANCVQH